MTDTRQDLHEGALPTPASACTAPIDSTASDTLTALVQIIRNCGMDPVTQLAGYLMTDDPLYLPDSGHARLLADRIGRDKLLKTLIETYLQGDASARSAQ